MVGWGSLWWLERGRGLRVDRSLEEKLLLLASDDDWVMYVNNLSRVARYTMVLLTVARWRQTSHAHYLFSKPLYL